MFDLSKKSTVTTQIFVEQLCGGGGSSGIFMLHTATAIKLIFVEIPLCRTVSFSEIRVPLPWKHLGGPKGFKKGTRSP